MGLHEVSVPFESQVAAFLDGQSTQEAIDALAYCPSLHTQVLEELRRKVDWLRKGG